jgi:hypothetical protein
LDVTNFSAIDSDRFVSTVTNAQTAVNGVYNAYYMDATWRGELYYYHLFATNELNYRHAQELYLPLRNFGYVEEATWFRDYWYALFSIVSRSNDVSSRLYNLKGNAGLWDKMTQADQVEIDKMIGECNFLRAFGYMWLTRSFGDKLPSNPAYNPAELGVPIQDSVVASKKQLLIPRNTLGECWDLVINNFLLAYEKLPAKWGVVAGINKTGAATKGAAAAYLGQIAMHYGDKVFPDGSGKTGYERAKYWLGQCMTLGNYQLVQNYYWNFDVAHENNSESIYEVQFDNEVKGYSGSYTWRLLGPNPVWWGTVEIPKEYINKFSAGNLITQAFFDDMKAHPSDYIGRAPNPLRVFPLLLERVFKDMVGITYPSAEDMFNSYTGNWTDLGNQLTQELNIRNFDVIKDDANWGTTDSKYFAPIARETQLDIDPRLYATAYIPNRDSIRVVQNGQLGAYMTYTTPYYGYKKGIPDDGVENWSSIGRAGSTDGCNSVNQRIYRLAEVYLQYAEVCYRTGNISTAYEYLNKVHRRSLGYPVDQPSPKDITGGNFMEYLVHEYEVELCGEGVLHFHYLRWWNAPYGAVNKYASRGFNPNKHHRLPIPLSERQAVGMDILKQNEGY